MPAPKYYEGQEFHNPTDPGAPVLVYRNGKFLPKAPVGQTVAPDALQSGQAVLTALDTARKQAGPTSTGLLGGWLGKIPGTAGYNLDRTADTIRGNLGFGKLMQMKATSPNGASGLGALSEGERRTLEALAGSVDIGQSEPQFRQNLDRVRQHVIRTTPGVNVDVPLDLSQGQSREQIPRGAFYRDPQGNIRKNENGDTGNPIMRGPGLQQPQAQRMSPEQAAQLPKGARFIGLDGVERVRQ